MLDDHNRRISPPLGSDSDQSTEPDIKPKSPPVGKLRRSYAVSTIEPSHSDYKPDEAEPEPVSGADWEMIDDSETPKFKRKAKPKMRDLIEAANEHKLQENDSEDNMVSTSIFFVNFDR